MPLTKHRKFDIDLDFGKKFEAQLCTALEGKGKIEVKTERDIWMDSGNIALEYSYDRKPSGLSTTEADWWIHVLSYEGKFCGAFMWPVKNLRINVKILLNLGYARKMKNVGDEGLSNVILVDLRRAYLLSAPVDEPKEISDETNKT